MKAIEITSYGAPEVLRVAQRPDPVAGAGELLIRVAASGVNRPDVLQRKGHYPVQPGASDLPGLEVAGEIVSGDAEALAEAGFKIGDRVCALIAGGGYAELCVAPVAQCLPVPKGWSDIDAASLPETFFDDKIDKHISMFRVLSYPPQREQPLPGQLRAGAHSDYGSLTIVLPDDKGLQVFNKAGQWVDVPQVEGGLVVNIA
ncbi:alcohol dehydrogenase catalytic domain-containing protein, partial [Variovorax sp. RHLX14]|uniref:alcohol dehydrogenase catalytic domain-containing protein n=1 Tax=Variovorax sp. RHLX14 TaxID=1259731 RepID=UPI003F477369